MTNHQMQNVWVDEIKAGKIVCNIGQLSKADLRAIERCIRAGIIQKFKGHFWPVSGAPVGIGPLKTCYRKAETAP